MNAIEKNQFTDVVMEIYARHAAEVDTLKREIFEMEQANNASHVETAQHEREAKKAKMELRAFARELGAFLTETVGEDGSNWPQLMNCLRFYHSKCRR